MSTKTSRVVLVVDDEPIICKVISRLVKSEGHDTVMASNLTEALSFLESSKFDLITLDLRLADKHGNELLAEMVRRNIETPVIVVSGDSDELVCHEQVKAVVTKPFAARELLLLLRQQLGHWFN
jgi:DNA-binding NtrC family response regulator